MSSVSPATNTPVLPIIGLAARQKELRDNSIKWKAAAVALAAIGAAVAAAAGVAFAVFKAIPVAALAGGVVAGVAILGLAILVYYKKVASIMTPEQLLEAIRNTLLKPYNEAKVIAKEFAKQLPESNKPLSREYVKKLTEQMETHKKELTAHDSLIRGKGFYEEAISLVALAADLGLEEAKKLKDAKTARVIAQVLIDERAYHKTDSHKEAVAAAETILSRLQPIADDETNESHRDAGAIITYARNLIKESSKT